MNTLERGLAYLGWQGGTIWQVEDALINQLGYDSNGWSNVSFQQKSTVFERVDMMLDKLESK